MATILAINKLANEKYEMGYFIKTKLEYQILNRMEIEQYIKSNDVSRIIANNVSKLNFDNVLYLMLSDNELRTYYNFHKIKSNYVFVKVTDAIEFFIYQDDEIFYEYKGKIFNNSKLYSNNVYDPLNLRQRYEALTIFYDSILEDNEFNIKNIYEAGKMLDYTSNILLEVIFKYLTQEIINTCQKYNLHKVVFSSSLDSQIREKYQKIEDGEKTIDIAIDRTNKLDRLRTLIKLGGRQSGWVFS